MSYNSERASTNVYSELLEYCQKNGVVDGLSAIIKANESESSVSSVADPIQDVITLEPISNVPVGSFDGGLAALFIDTLTEVSIVKSAGGCPPEWEAFFGPTAFSPVFFHSYIGRLLHEHTFLEGSHADKEAHKRRVIEEEVDRLFQVPDVLSMTTILEAKELKKELIACCLRWRSSIGASYKSAFREILELSRAFVCLQALSPGKTEELPFLIVKDGGLSSPASIISGLLFDQLQKLYGGNLALTPLIVGVVKSSRFVGDNSIGKWVRRACKEIPSHSFFKLHPKLEAVLDPEAGLNSNKLQRRFLSLYGGDAIFEIQLPTGLSEAQKTKALRVILGQVTLLYGGSIAANSYAHINASLAESEVKQLERTIDAKIHEGSKQS